MKIRWQATVFAFILIAAGQAQAGIRYMCWQAYSRTCVEPPGGGAPICARQLAEKCRFVDTDLGVGVGGPVFLRRDGNLQGVLNPADFLSANQEGPETCNKDDSFEPDVVTSTNMPVVISTGEKTLTETDFSSSSEVPLGIGRVYSSLNTNNGSFGQYWSSSIDFGLKFESGSTYCTSSLAQAVCMPVVASITKIFVRRPGGGYVPLTQGAPGQWVDEASELSLTKVSTGWVLVDVTSGSETYNEYGQPKEIRNLIGAGWNFIYGPGGALSTIQHTNGRSIAIGWSSNKISSVTDPALGVYQYAYSGQGVIQSVTFPGGLGQRTYHYEVSGKPWLLTGISVNGVRETRYSYHSDGRVRQSGHESGANVSVFNYGSTSTSVTNALGQTTTYHKNSDGQISQIDRPATAVCAASTVLHEYADGQVTKVVDQLGNANVYIYSPLGRIQQQSIGRSVAGPTTETTHRVWEWDPTETQVLAVHDYGSVISSKNLIRTTSFQYYSANEAGGKPRQLKRIIVDDRKTSAPDREIAFSYQFWLPSGTIREQIVDGPLAGSADRTTYTFDTAGDLARITNPLGHVVEFSQYNGRGLPGQYRDENGRDILYEYDAKGRPTKQTIVAASGNRVTTFSYDAFDNIVTVTDPSGRVLNLTRDVAGNVTQLMTSAAHPLGPDAKDIRNLTYNNLGQLLSSSTRQSYLKMVIIGYEGGEPIMDYVRVADQFSLRQWTYDSGGRLASQVGNNGQNFRFAYDANAMLASITDSMNNVTSRTYDRHGRVKTVSAPNSGTSSFEYNAFGQLQKVVDGRGNVTAYEYNGFGDLTQITSPDSGVTTYRYDSAGRLSETVRADGTITTFVRDVLGRVISESTTWASQYSVTTPDINTFTYDSCTKGIGRLCSFSSAVGAGPSTSATNYTYSATGEIASQYTTISGATFSLTYTHDSFGRLSTATYPNGVVLRYSYSLDHQIERIEAFIGGTWKNVISQASYQPFAGALTSLLHGNGLNRIQEYDQDGRLARVYGTGSTHPQNLSLTYNVNNLVTAVVNTKNPSASQSYDYNSFGGVIAASSTTTGSQTFQYDAVGNRISHTWGGGTDIYGVASSSNRLLSISGPRPRNISYDPNGNIRYETRAGVTVERQYNGSNRLTRLIRPSSQAFAQPNGATLNLPAGSWEYQYNALRQRVRKSLANSSTATRYLYGPAWQLLGESSSGSGSLDTIYVWLGSRPVALIRSGAIFAIHSDHLGRPEVVTNPAKSVVWRASNSAFDRTVTTDLFGGLSLGFPGQQWDPEAGTWYNVFRDYDASTGRYITSDPLGLRAGLNTYAYVRGNPVNLADPLGLVVEVCRDPAFDGDAGPFKHFWVKTDTMEVGMGTREAGANAGNQYDYVLSPVETIDHSGRSKGPDAKCEVVEGVDEDKVNELLALEQDLGRFMPFVNDCQGFARSVIDQAGGEFPYGQPSSYQPLENRPGHE